jgi:hypothetical protein
VGSGAHRDRTCVGVGGWTVGNADEGSVCWSPKLARWSMRYAKSKRTSLWQRPGRGTAGGGCQRRGARGRSSRWGTDGAGSDKGSMRPMIESESTGKPVRSSWRLKRARSRGVLLPMAGGVGGRRCTRTERAEAGSRASRGGENGLGFDDSPRAMRPEARRTWRRHRMAGAWRWRGSVAARGEHSDEAMARAFKRWVRLTGGPSPPFDLIRFSKAPASKFTNMIFRMSKKW